MSSEQIKLRKYVFIFCAYYIPLMIALNIVAHGFGVDLGSSADVGIFIGSAFAAAMKFVTDNQRAPSIPEKRKLCTGCLLASFGISALLGLIVLPIIGGMAAYSEIAQLFSALSPFIWLAILVAVGLLYYFFLNLIFGWFSRKYAAKVVNAEM